jgi:uncharacterized protein YegJ (DUF2314 family)
MILQSIVSRMNWIWLTPILGAALLSGCGDTPERGKQDGQPNVVAVDDEDSQMDSAISKAKDTVETFIEALKAPKPTQQKFAVKKPFKTNDGGMEHIWITSVRHDGKNFLGELGNDPVNVPSIKFGDPVTVASSEISDWMYLEDGKIVGGYTMRVIRQRMDPAEAAEFDKRIKFKD